MTDALLKLRSLKVEPRARDVQGEPPEDNPQDYAPIHFPVHVLPAKIARLVNRSHEVFCFPPEFTGLMVLVVFATAIGNAFRIRFKSGFVQPAILFAAIIGRPNSAKSPVFSFTTAVLRRREKVLYKEYKDAKDRYDAYEELSAAERKEKEKPPKPINKQLITSDATLEGIYEACRNNPKGMVFMADELMSWFQSISKYNSGNDIPHYLSLWSGYDISTTRKTERIYITKPHLCICGGIQQGIIRNLFKGDNSFNGLPDRFLYSQIAEFTVPMKTLEEIEEEIVTDYETAVERLLDIPFTIEDGSSSTVILDMTGEARNEFMAWANGDMHRTRLLEEQGESYIGALGKADLTCMRLALIIQMMRWALDEADCDAVDEESMQAAIVLTEYFKKQTERVFRLAVDHDIRLGMTTQMRNIYDALPSVFRTGEMIAVAKRFGMSKRTVNRVLKQGLYFRKENHGNYEKLN